MMYAQMSRFCSEGESTQSVLPKYDCNTRQPNGARSVSVVVGFFSFSLSASLLLAAAAVATADVGYLFANIAACHKNCKCNMGHVAKRKCEV